MHVHKRGNESVCKRIRRGTEVHLYFLRHVEFIPTSVNQFGCLMKSFLCSEAMSSAWGLHYVQRWSTWYSDLDLRHYPYSLLMRKLVALTTKQKKSYFGGKCYVQYVLSTTENNFDHAGTNCQRLLQPC
jgi:hypothetical protein